jgi:hypothetical protein
MRKLSRAVGSGVAPAGAALVALVALGAALAPRAAHAQEAHEPDGELSAPPALAGRLIAVADPASPLAAPPAPDAPPVPAHRPRQRFARSGDANDPDAPTEGEPDFRDKLRVTIGPLRIQPSVLMQAQGIPYVGGDSTLEAGDPADRAGFRMRRARFGFDGRLFHNLPFQINAEWNSDSEFKPSGILHDAWFGYDHFRFAQIFVGYEDVPFSRSALTGAGESALIERPFSVRAMAPFHQLGLHLEGHFFAGAINYYAGVYNGLLKAGTFYQGFVENPSVLGNRFDGLTYVARITSEPFGSLGRTMEDLHHGKLKIAAGAGAFYSDGGTVGVLGLGGDILLHYRGLHLLGEFIANRTTPAVAPTQATTQTGIVTSYGAIGEAGYMVLRERLGISARFEWVIPNTGVKDQSDGWMFTGGASYHIYNDFLKAQLDYTHREELHGKSLQNDSVVLQAQLNF